ncbi:uncharacterized protein LOC141784055 [Sebastes fasciatus]|uniref:uncharacterized protein LOC141784055 n=1 Tax=Sebastes fasciatus TaxID=394691 RepID=UPI003D9F61C4
MKGILYLFPLYNLCETVESGLPFISDAGLKEAARKIKIVKKKVASVLKKEHLNITKAADVPMKAVTVLKANKKQIVPVLKKEQMNVTKTEVPKVPKVEAKLEPAKKVAAPKEPKKEPKEKIQTKPVKPEVPEVPKVKAKPEPAKKDAGLKKAASRIKIVKKKVVSVLKKEHLNITKAADVPMKAVTVLKANKKQIVPVLKKEQMNTTKTEVPEVPKVKAKPEPAKKVAAPTEPKKEPKEKVKPKPVKQGNAKPSIEA